MRPHLVVLVSVLAGTSMVCADAAADVTLRGQQVATSMGLSIAGETTVFFKGLKQRIDSVIRGRQLTTIVDLGAELVIVVDHESKSAQSFHLGPAALEFGGVRQQIQVRMEPTGTSRQMASMRCGEYRVLVSLAAAGGTGGERQLIDGRAWIAEDAAGRGDSARFYAAARDGRLPLGDPRAVRTDPWRALALTALQARASEAGVVCGVHVELMETNPARSAVPVASLSNELTDWSSTTVDDAVFTVPRGYVLEKK